jgi:hypothetical protein
MHYALTRQPLYARRPENPTGQHCSGEVGLLDEEGALLGAWDDTKEGTCDGCTVGVRLGVSDGDSEGGEILGVTVGAHESTRQSSTADSQLHPCEKSSNNRP